MDTNTVSSRKDGFSKRCRNVLTELKKNKALFFMLLPGVIVYILFNYLPMFGLLLAFKSINYRDGIFGSPWVGLANFKFMTKSGDLLQSVINILGYNFVFLFIGTFMAIALAIALDLIGNKLAKKAYQTIMIMPHFLSWVVVAYLLFSFLSLENGIFNRYLMPLLGLEPINWYQTPNVWPVILIIAHFWKEWGFESVIYTAAISGIDVQQYEAAKIDGANLWQIITRITLPSIRQMVVIMLIMKVGGILTTDMGLFYQLPMNQPALYEKTNVISTYVYNLVTNSGSLAMGMASAASFVQSVVGFVLVLTVNWVAKKIDSSNALF